MLAGCAGVKSAFLIKRREAPHFLSVLSSVFGKKSGGIFIKPNLKAAENKGWRIRETIDFGRGFYLTSSKKQAESFVSTSLRKAKAKGMAGAAQRGGVVSTFRYHYNGNVTGFIFRDADADWLHCVVGHRKANTFPNVVEGMKKYDIIAGKIADDTTNVTILAYLIGAYGAIGSREADVLCISRLIPERLENQFCFRTDEGLKCLSFVESREIWKN